ncbi:MAG: hypothetical protein IKF51_08550 [Solobacterium sp.]|nr:hypothetical protein [Solobacterium sp.]
MNKQFVLEHLKRNRTVYQICLFIFRMFAAGAASVIVLRLMGRLDGNVRFFDFILCGGFAFNILYMKRLTEFSDAAIDEITHNKPHSEGTQIVLKMIIRDPKRLRAFAALMFLMSVLVIGGAGVILWTIRENAGPLEIIVGISFLLIGIPLFALGVSYLQDARSILKYNQTNHKDPDA